MRVRKNNSGFTLIEMMVSMAILSIVLMGAAWILSQMTRSFSESQKEVQLQDNMQATYSIVSGLVKEAQSVNKGITGKYNSVLPDGNRVYIFTEEVDRDNSGMYLQVPEVDSGVLYIIEFVSSENRLYLYNQEYNPLDYISGTVGAYTFNQTKFEDEIKNIPSSSVTTRNNLLSNNVKSFEVVDKTDDGYVIVSLELEYGKRHASITQNVYLRNSNKTVQTGGSGLTDTPTDTPTTAPTTPPAGSGFTLTSQGIINQPTKDTISSHADISVTYESGYQTVEQEVPVYKMLCPNGHELKENQRETWNNPVTIKYQCTWTDWGNPCPYMNYGAITIVEGHESDYQVATGETQVVQVPTGNSGTIEIKNESLSTDYIGVEITLYFEASDAYFAPIPGAGTTLLKVNGDSRGNQACTYYSSAPDGSGRCKYIKICIPELKKAETYTDGGEDKVRYDNYLIDYSWYTSSGNRPVMCAYSITAY